MLSADTAVFVLARMPLTLRGTAVTGKLTRLNRGAQHFFVGTRSARSERTGRPAKIGAIEIQANALAQLLDHRLRKTCVRACDARLSASEALVDAAHERRAVVTSDIGMRSDHLLRVHDVPFACVSERKCNAAFLQQFLREVRSKIRR